MTKKTLIIWTLLFLIIINITSESTTIKLWDNETEVLGDAEVRQTDPTTNYGAGTYMIVDPQSGDIRRSYIKFNITPIIDAGATNIIEAKLFLYQNSGEIDNGTDVKIGVHHVYNQTWTEGTITWNAQPCNISIDSTKCNAVSEENKTVSGTGDWNNFTVTEMTENETLEGNPYITIMLIGEPEPNNNDYAGFRTKEYTTINQRPYLNITYEVNETPTLESYDTEPEITYPNQNQNITFNMTCSENEGDSITAYLQVWNGTTKYEGVTSMSIANNTNIKIYELNSSYTYAGQNWTGEYWCGDGNTNSTKQNDTVTITNPTINLLTSDNIITADTTQDIIFNISSYHSITANCTLYIDGVSKGTSTNTPNGTNTTITSSELSQGNKTYNITCIYAPGYDFTSDNQIIVIDTTRPTITLSSPANGYISVIDNTPDFIFTPEESINNTVSCELLIDGDGYGINSSTVNNTLTTITANHSLSEGTHNWRVGCSDEIGVGYSSYRSITISTVNPSVNFTFVNQGTGNLVNDRNITLEIMTNASSYNYSTDDGWINVTIVEDVGNIIRYNAEDFKERFYYLLLSDEGNYNVTLYMINESDAYNVSVTVVDQNAEVVEGAIVKALKYDIATNSYILMEVSLTNFLGEAPLSLTYNDEFYKFIVEYDGETLKTTNPTYITTDSYTIQIITDEVYGYDFEHYRSLDFSLTFNNATDNFRLEYNDVSGSLTRVCLYVYNQTLTGSVLLNNSCLTTAAGTILLGITSSNNSYYNAKAYYSTSTITNHLLASMDYSPPVGDDFGNLGLFLQIFITVTIAMTALWKIEIAAILTPLSLILGRVLHFNLIPYYYLVPLLVVGIFIAFITGNRA